MLRQRLQEQDTPKQQTDLQKIPTSTTLGKNISNIFNIGPSDSWARSSLTRRLILQVILLGSSQYFQLTMCRRRPSLKLNYLRSTSFQVVPITFEVWNKFWPTSNQTGKPTASVISKPLDLNNNAWSRLRVRLNKDNIVVAIHMH
jgi:hypothetical protein